MVMMFFAMTSATYAQTITGTVNDETGPLPGANVLVKGTTTGTQTDFDGKFSLKVAEGSGTVVISFVGYAAKQVSYAVAAGETKDLGTITLASDNTLDEVVVVGRGVVDLVKERETPVAASTIRAVEIQNKLGNQEFPEILNTTPSVYATKTGGGYGDGTMRVRGFGQVNTAVIINGQPVNDMENGRVYWSNWQGLSDVASGMQIQRGLGASKLAVPSVGGTLTVVTRSTEKEQGGTAKVSLGNDGYLKTVASYNTGLSEKGWAASVLLGRWQGNGYVDGTEGEGYTYLFSLGYKPSERSAFNFTFTGAGQWHNQRSTRLSIRDQINFGGDDFRRYNADWGTLNGKEYSMRRNFYNKPIATLNWDYNFNDKLSLSTSIYGSWGRGGGTGPRGNNFRNSDINLFPFRIDLTEHARRGNGLASRNPDGSINFDNVVRVNRATTDPYSGANEDLQGLLIGSNGFRDDDVNRAVLVRRASMNSHNWYGGISNLKYETGNWTLGAGVDLRTYTGFHYRVLNDLLGLDGYYSTGNENQPGGLVISETIEASPFRNTGLNSTNKIDYYNVGKVNWAGFNGIVEYNDGEKLSAVLQGGVSNQSYQRIDYFDQGLDFESDKESITGGYIKGGANYNINEAHNVFFNAGRIARQPFFDAVFPGFSNNVNKDAENENITSFELGYGYTSQVFKANLNLYSTTWANRFISKSIRGVDAVDDGTATFAGLKQVHTGLELDFTVRPIEKLRFNGMLSVGNWVYKDNVTASVFDGDQNLVDQATLYIDGTKVGDAAQVTASLSGTYEIFENFDFDLSWRYADQLYSDFSFQFDTRNWANDAQYLSPNNRGALQLPSYHLFDLGLGYKFNFDKSDLGLRFNVNNLFDTEYIAEGSSSIYTNDTNPETDAPVSTWKGIDTRNQVWFGFGRTWSVSARYTF